MTIVHGPKMIEFDRTPAFYMRGYGISIFLNFIYEDRIVRESHNCALNGIPMMIILHRDTIEQLNFILSEFTKVVPIT